MSDAMGHGWAIVAAVYAVMSGVTFLAYHIDKTRAVRGRRRISEATLHGLEVLGGWPGGFVAQRVIRHKNRKASYQVVYWSIVCLHVAAAWLILR